MAPGGTRPPPDVTITSPAAGLKSTFCTGGTAVPVTISAVDPQSPVTVVWFAVNGTGFTVNPFAPANTVGGEGQFVAPVVVPMKSLRGPRAPAGPASHPRSASASTMRCPGCRAFRWVARSTARCRSLIDRGRRPYGPSSTDSPRSKGIESRPAGHDTGPSHAPRASTIHK